MAWSETTRPTSETDSLAFDKPLLVGGGLAHISTSIEWRTTGSFSSGSNGVDSSYPTTNMVDDFQHKFSRPSSSAVTWYIIGQFASNVTFNFCAILGHNFGTIGGLTVSLQIADDNAFTTNLVTLRQESPGTSNKRLIWPYLSKDAPTGGLSRNYAAQYWRIKIDGTSGQPRVGEIILGLQRQLNQKPNEPYDPSQTVSQVDYFDPGSGVVTQYSRYRGRRKLDAEIVTTSSTEDAIVNGWYTSCNQGTRPFLWIENPTTDPKNAPYLILNEPGLFRPYDNGPSLRTWNLNAIEQGTSFVLTET